MQPEFGYFTLWGILLFLVTMTVLTAAHEYGHYKVARLFGMEIEEFAIGFGKKVFVRPMRQGGEFSLRAIPLGGFVRTRGMVPEEDGSEVNIPNGFYSKSPFSRFCMLLAGPVASIIAGWVLLFGLAFFGGVGEPKLDPVIGGLAKEGAGYKAGLREGDRIQSIDGKPIGSFFDMVSHVRERADQKLNFTIVRGTETQQLVVTPVKDKAPTPVLDSEMKPTVETKIQGKIGAGPQVELTRNNAAMAFTATNETIREFFRRLGAMFGSIKVLRENVGSPIAIVDGTSRAADAGIVGMVGMAGILSISMGIFNLLPISPLDGGQMVVALIEMLRGGRRLSYKLQNQIALAGVSMIVMLFGFVIFNDISKLIAR